MLAPPQAVDEFIYGHGRGLDQFNQGSNNWPLDEPP